MNNSNDSHLKGPINFRRGYFYDIAAINPKITTRKM